MVPARKRFSSLKVVMHIQVSQKIIYKILYKRKKIPGASAQGIARVQ